MKTSFLNEEELEKIGFKSIGKNAMISRNATFYYPEEMVLGDHVRIDDFCLLSGKITLGNYIHISAYTALYGKFGIELKDYSGLSPRVTVFSASDDFSGEFAVGPIFPKEIIKLNGGKVLIEEYVQVGSGSIILPEIRLHEGSAIGAMSLVNKDIPAWKIAAGIPAKILKDRKNDLILKINSID